MTLGYAQHGGAGLNRIHHHKGILFQMQILFDSVQGRSCPLGQDVLVQRMCRGAGGNIVFWFQHFDEHLQHAYVVVVYINVNRIKYVIYEFISKNK